MELNLSLISNSADFQKAQISPTQSGRSFLHMTVDQTNQISLGQIRSDQMGSDLRSDQVRSGQMRADIRLGQIRSGQMKKDPPRSESDPLKIHISEIITALFVGAAL